MCSTKQISVRVKRRGSLGGNAHIVRNERESERPEIAVEREDVVDIVGIGERARRVIDERDLLVVEPSELLTDQFELRFIRVQDCEVRRLSDSPQCIRRFFVAGFSQEQRRQLAQHVSSCVYRPLSKLTRPNPVHHGACPVVSR